MFWNLILNTQKKSILLFPQGNLIIEREKFDYRTLAKKKKKIDYRTILGILYSKREKKQSQTAQRNG